MLVVGGTGAFAGLLALCVAPGLPFIIISMAALGASLGLVVPGNLAAMSLATGMGAQGKVAGINTVALGIGLALADEQSANFVTRACDRILATFPAGRPSEPGEQIA
jgi:hypothetical protein